MVSDIHPNNHFYNIPLHFGEAVFQYNYIISSPLRARVMNRFRR